MAEFSARLSEDVVAPELPPDVAEIQEDDGQSSGSGLSDVREEPPEPPRDVSELSAVEVRQAYRRSSFIANERGQVAVTSDDRRGSAVLPKAEEAVANSTDYSLRRASREYRRASRRASREARRASRDAQLLPAASQPPPEKSPKVKSSLRSYKYRGVWVRPSVISDGLRAKYGARNIEPFELHEGVIAEENVGQDMASAILSFDFIDRINDDMLYHYLPLVDRTIGVEYGLAHDATRLATPDVSFYDGDANAEDYDAYYEGDDDERLDYFDGASGVVSEGLSTSGGALSRIASPNEEATACDRTSPVAASVSARATPGLQSDGHASGGMALSDVDGELDAFDVADTPTWGTTRKSSIGVVVARPDSLLPSYQPHEVVDERSMVGLGSNTGVPVAASPPSTAGASSSQRSRWLRAVDSVPEQTGAPPFFTSSSAAQRAPGARTPRGEERLSGMNFLELGTRGGMRELTRGIPPQGIDPAAADASLFALYGAGASKSRFFGQRFRPRKKSSWRTEPGAARHGWRPGGDDAGSTGPAASAFATGSTVQGVDSRATPTTPAPRVAGAGASTSASFTTAPAGAGTSAGLGCTVAPGGGGQVFASHDARALPEVRVGAGAVGSSFSCAHSALETTSNSVEEVAGSAVAGLGTAMAQVDVERRPRPPANQNCPFSRQSLSSAIAVDLRCGHRFALDCLGSARRAAALCCTAGFAQEGTLICPLCGDQDDTSKPRDCSQLTTYSTNTDAYIGDLRKDWQMPLTQGSVGSTSPSAHSRNIMRAPPRTAPGRPSAMAVGGSLALTPRPSTTSRSSRFAGSVQGTSPLLASMSART